MANPRRASYTSSLPTSDPIPQFQSQAAQSTATTLFTSLKVFLKKPHAFPFLLSIFLLLTWISLRFQHGSPNSSFSQPSYRVTLKNVDHLRDSDANAVRFSSSSPRVMKDKRGWLINPLSLAMDFNIPGGAVSCVSTHIGEIRPGNTRGNHRHHSCNETFVIWGAKTMFRLENKAINRGYAEIIVSADEVAVVASPRGTAHALVNVDEARSTYFFGCQDSINHNASATDFKVWRDL